MRLPLILLLLTVASAVPQSLTAQPLPRMTTVEPPNGKVGDILSVTGENLDKANVAQVYLTDGKNDFPATASEQTSTSMKVKIPNAVKPGRYSLMVLTTGKEPKLIEQPVRVTVEPAAPS